MAELAGLEMPGVDGTSFAPLLLGEPFAGRTESLEVMPRSNEASYEGWSALRTPEHRFIRWDDGQRELYDLVEDPWELTNLVATEPETAAHMEARLDELMAAAG